MRLTDWGVPRETKVLVRRCEFDFVQVSIETRCLTEGQNIQMVQILEVSDIEISK